MKRFVVATAFTLGLATCAQSVTPPTASAAGLNTGGLYAAPDDCTLSGGVAAADHDPASGVTGRTSRHCFDGPTLENSYRGAIANATQ